MPALQALGQVGVNGIGQLLVRPAQRSGLVVVGYLGPHLGIAQNAPGFVHIVAHAQQAQLGNGHSRTEAGEQQSGVPDSILGAADLGYLYRVLQLVILNNDGLRHLSP